MKIPATSSSGKARKPLQPGKYRAAITGFIHLGTQPGGMYGPKNQAIVVFTPFDEDDDRPILNDDAQPHTISRFYTLSFNVKSALRKDVETITGLQWADNEEFDPHALIGQQARITVVNEDKVGQDGKTYKKDKIKSVESCSKRDKIDTDVVAKIPHLYFEITGTHCPIPSEVGDWAMKQIQASPEWSGTQTPSRAVDPSMPAAGAGVSFDEFTASDN